MDEILELLHDYVAMLSQITDGNKVLSAAERAKWLALSRLIPGTGRAPEPSPDDDENGMPLQITAPGGFESARLLAVSRDGLRIFLAHPLLVGAHTIVRLIAPRGGLEYTFPCKVVWAERDRIGLAFDGAPKKIPLSRSLDVGWKRPLDLRTGWGVRAPNALA